MALLQRSITLIPAASARVRRTLGACIGAPEVRIWDSHVGQFNRLTGNPPQILSSHAPNLCDDLAALVPGSRRFRTREHMPSVGKSDPNGSGGRPRRHCQQPEL